MQEMVAGSVPQAIIGVEASGRNFKVGKEEVKQEQVRDLGILITKNSLLLHPDHLVGIHIEYPPKGRVPLPNRMKFWKSAKVGGEGVIFTVNTAYTVDTVDIVDTVDTIKGVDTVESVTLLTLLTLFA